MYGRMMMCFRFIDPDPSTDRISLKNHPTHPSIQTTKPIRYAFEAGPVHFLVLNFEKEFGPGSPQFEFASRDLEENVDRQRTPWVRKTEGGMWMVGCVDGRSDVFVLV